MVSAKKQRLGDKLTQYLNDYSKVLIVSVDNVGSKQFATIRFALRGKANLIKVKNTMARTLITACIDKGGNEGLKKLLEVVGSNMAFVFCEAPVDEVRDIIISHRVPAPAKAGVIAPGSVTIPAGPTTMEPSMTSFFQALGIATKIVKGKIEIISDVAVVTEGEKVGPSEAVLLHKMNIQPFSYGFVSSVVYDEGKVYPASVLDITDEMLNERMVIAVQNLAALGMATGVPNTASVPHSLAAAFRNCAALCAATEVGVIC